MLQLCDTTPFRSGLFVLPNPEGVESLVIVVKASFRIGPQLEIAADQGEVVLGDQYGGAPEASSIVRANEVHTHKVGTDVLVLGEVCAPRGQPVTELDVVVRVAGRQKVVRVFGDRHWTEGLAGVVPGRPVPFARMPLAHERAYGGSDPADESEAGSDLRNPVGMGHLGRRNARELLGLPVPNFELPGQLLTKLGQVVEPAGLGPLAPHWQPRLGFAGTYDAHWAKTRAPHLPEDFDPRFFNAAPVDQQFEAGLQGGEPLAMLGLHPAGMCEFSLPQCTFRIDVRIEGGHERPQAKLDTVVLIPSEARLEMIWRAELPVDKRVLRVEQVEVGLDHLHGALEPAGGVA